MGTHIIGGTTYHVLTETTMEQDAAILREVRAVGVRHFEPDPGETASAYLERILISIVEGGQATRMLGCLLVPDGQQWTRALAEETGAKFARITDPADKAILRSLLMPLLQDFFAVGLTSATTSRRYSAALRGIFGQPRKIEGASTSVSGRTSFALSPAGILAAPLKWLVGRFGKRFSPTSRP